MLFKLKHFVAILLSLAVSRADESDTNDNDLSLSQNNLDYISHEGNSFDGKLSVALLLLKTELEKNILDKLKEYVDGKIDSLEKHMNQKNDALEKSLPGLPNKTHGYWDCKNRTVNNIHDIELFRLDHNTFNFLTLKSNDGGLTHFEMRFAVKGTIVHIQLSMVPHLRIGEGYFIIQIDNAFSYVLIGRRTTDGSGVTFAIIMRSDLPTGLLKDRYTPYYFKITNQTLEVRKQGSNTPLIQYTDARFRSVRYVGFTSWPSFETSCLYDCPPHFEETIF